MLKSEHQISLVGRLLLIVFIGNFAVVCLAQFGGGQGTEANPYQIARVAHLNNIRNHLDAHFIQTADIRLDEHPWNAGEGWEPIGTDGNDFFGSFDGNGHVITGLMIDRTDRFQGLFGYLGRDSVLRNVTLLEVDIRDGGQSTGALIGGSGNSRIYNCTVQGSVSSTAGRAIGGFIGGVVNHRPYFENCVAHVEVFAPNADRVGGFVGDGWGDHRSCGATGDVTGRNSVGGFAGREYNSHQQGQLFASGNVTGNNEVGGFAGFLQTATYRDIYAKGDVTGNNQVGGLVGNFNLSGNNVHRAYATGRVTGQDQVGGLIGRLRDGGQTVNSYWNTETTGQAESRCGEPRDTRHMTYPYEPNTYEGWDFDDIWVADEENRHGGYPYFQWYDLEPDIVPDPPVVNLEIVEIDQEKHLRFTWQLVEDALSYRIYLSSDPYAADWGDPIQVLGPEADEYLEPIDEDYIKKFFHVTASSAEAP